MFPELTWSEHLDRAAYWRGRYRELKRSGNERGARLARQWSAGSSYAAGSKKSPLEKLELKEWFLMMERLDREDLQQG